MFFHDAEHFPGVYISQFPTGVMFPFKIESFFFFLVESDVDFRNVQYIMPVFLRRNGIKILIQGEMARIKFHGTFGMHGDDPEIDF